MLALYAVPPVASIRDAKPESRVVATSRRSQWPARVVASSADRSSSSIVRAAARSSGLRLLMAPHCNRKPWPWLCCGDPSSTSWDPRTASSRRKLATSRTRRTCRRSGGSASRPSGLHRPGTAGSDGPALKEAVPTLVSAVVPALGQAVVPALAPEAPIASKACTRKYHRRDPPVLLRALLPRSRPTTGLPSAVHMPPSRWCAVSSCSLRPGEIPYRELQKAESYRRGHGNCMCQ